MLIIFYSVSSVFRYNRVIRSLYVSQSTDLRTIFFEICRPTAAVEHDLETLSLGERFASLSAQISGTQSDRFHPFLFRFSSNLVLSLIHI